MKTVSNRYRLASMNLLKPALALLLCCATSSAAATGLATQQQTLTVAGETWTLTVPQGLQLELLTDRLDTPRLMTFLPNRDLIIGSRSGKVYRLARPTGVTIGPDGALYFTSDAHTRGLFRLRMEQSPQM
jgi:glucose/arabinose dehydrogenase